MILLGACILVGCIVAAIIFILYCLATGDLDD